MKKTVEQPSKAQNLKCCFRTIEAQQEWKKILVGEREKSQLTFWSKDLSHDCDFCCFLPAGKPSPFPWVQIFLKHCDCNVLSQGFAQKAGAHGAVQGRQLLLLPPFPSWWGALVWDGALTPIPACRGFPAVLNPHENQTLTRVEGCKNPPWSSFLGWPQHEVGPQQGNVCGRAGREGKHNCEEGERLGWNIHDHQKPEGKAPGLSSG